MGRRWKGWISAGLAAALFGVGPGCFRSDLIWDEESTHEIRVSESLYFSPQLKTAGDCLVDFDATFVRKADGEIDDSLSEVPVQLVLFTDPSCGQPMPVYNEEEGVFRGDGVVQRLNSGTSGTIPFYPNTSAVTVGCVDGTPGRVTRAMPPVYLQIQALGFGRSSCLGPVSISPAAPARVRGLGNPVFPVGTASAGSPSLTIQLQDQFGNPTNLPGGATVTVTPAPTPQPTNAAYPTAAGAVNTGSVALSAYGTGSIPFDPVVGVGKIRGIYTVNGTVAASGVSLLDNTFSAQYTLTGHLGAAALAVKDLPGMQLFAEQTYSARVMVTDSFGNTVNDFTGTVNAEIDGHPAGSVDFFAWDGGEKVLPLAMPSTLVSSNLVQVSSGAISGSSSPSTVTSFTAPVPVSTPSSPPTATNTITNISWGGVNVAGSLTFAGGNHVINGPGELTINGDLACIPGDGQPCRIWINGNVRVLGSLDIHAAGLGTPSLVYLGPGAHMEVTDQVRLGTSGSYYGTGLIQDPGSVLRLGTAMHLLYGGQFTARGSPGRRAELVSNALGSNYFYVSSSPSNYGFTAFHTNIRGLSRSGLGLQYVSQTLLGGIDFSDYEYDATSGGGTIITLGSGLYQNTLFDLRFEHAPLNTETYGIALINPCNLSIGPNFQFSVLRGHGFNPRDFSVTDCPGTDPNIQWSFTGAY